MRLTSKSLAPLANSFSLTLLDLRLAGLLSSLPLEPPHILLRVTDGGPGSEESPVGFALSSLSLHKAVACCCDGGVLAATVQERGVTFRRGGGGWRSAWRAGAAAK